MTTPPTDPVLLTIDQAAELISMSPRYVRRLVSERRIAVHRLGRAVRINRDDLAAFIAETREEPITASSVWKDLRGVA
jgi:excisionase family DNA binding protein